MSVWLYREKIYWYQRLGSVLAAAGLLCIFFVSDGTVTFTGMLLVIAGSFCWAASNFIVREARTTELLGFLVWSCLFAPLPLLAMSWYLHDTLFLQTQLLQYTPSVWLALMYQVYPSTLFGYTVWNYLLKQYSVSQVAPLSLLVPVFGMGVSAWFFSETLSPLKLVAAGMILLGLICNVFGQRWWRVWAGSSGVKA